MLCQDGLKNESANRSKYFACGPPWKHQTLEVKQKDRQTACSRGDSLIGSLNDYFRDLLLFSNILYEETYIFFVRTRRTKLTFGFEWQVTTYDQTRSLNLPSF